MCFSATASFVAGGSLSAAGLATLRQAKTKTRVPFAAIPLLFGAQQLIEGVVWLSFDRPIIHALSTYAYTLFSHVFWPFYLPLAVMMIEIGPRRKKILSRFVLFGLAVSLYLLYFVLQGPVLSYVGGNSLVYEIPHPNNPIILAAYLIATCASCQFSSHKFVRVFGVTLFGALLVALWFYSYAFYSVWCFFAAILSLIIYVHLTQKERLGLAKKSGVR